MNTNTFKLLLHETNGFTPEKFHEIYDNKSHTITIINEIRRCSQWFHHFHEKSIRKTTGEFLTEEYEVFQITKD
ncbi:hypothetical protein C1646_760575 [Rhizophagus diaphanus]|nr:hypothetical protein C1646_760575 [Rhizophagus diaphanus] [Rhizophagus sp. MUCL 43196]